MTTKKPLKIATEPIYDPYGGLCTYTANMRKFSSHVIREYPSGIVKKAIDRNADIRRLYRKFMMNRAMKGFDIVHSQSDPWFINLCRAAGSDKCRWVHTFHAVFHEEDYTGGLEEWQKDQNQAVLDAAREADVSVSVSKWGHDFLLEKYSIDTTVIENGVDLEICDAARPERFIKKYGINNFVLFIGSFREVKNPKLYVELAVRMPGARFVMIGDGIDRITLERKYNIRAPENLILLGRIKNVDVLDAISASRVYVMTSKHEGLPYTLLEAMAMRKPVVVPAHTGCVELVPTEEYGFLYDVMSIDGLFEKVKQAMDPGPAGENARRRIEENYDCRIVSNRMDMLYESLR